MSIYACAPPDANASLVTFHQHAAPVRPRYPECAATAVVLESATLDLHAWNVALLRMLVMRRRMSPQERAGVKLRLGDRWFARGRNYT